MRRVGNVLLYGGVICLVLAGIAFTTALPEPLARIGEWCFYGWWAPFFAGYLLKKLAGRQPAA